METCSIYAELYSGFNDSRSSFIMDRMNMKNFSTMQWSVLSMSSSPVLNCSFWTHHNCLQMNKVPVETMTLGPNTQQVQWAAAQLHTLVTLSHSDRHTAWGPPHCSLQMINCHKGFGFQEIILCRSFFYFYTPGLHRLKCTKSNKLLNVPCVFHKHPNTWHGEMNSLMIANTCP